MSTFSTNLSSVLPIFFIRYNIIKTFVDKVQSYTHKGQNTYTLCSITVVM